MTGAVCFGVFMFPSVGSASVGRPAGTVMTAVPFGIVNVKIWRDFGAREQYPISTQLSPPAPDLPGGGMNVDAGPTELVVSTRAVAFPLGARRSQSYAQLVTDHERLKRKD
jgi:hypothetical protein